MKTRIHLLLISFLIAATSIAHAGSRPPVDVTVLKPDGKVAYKAKTGANGTFATGKLDPGNYVVQFNSDSLAMKNNQFAIVVSAGKKKVSADAVDGEKFNKGGVAMKLEVGAGMNITGQVTDALTVTSTGTTAKVKIINGKRYVWVGPETGSNMGGRWVEESAAAAGSANNVRRSGAAALQSREDHADVSSGPGGG